MPAPDHVSVAPASGSAAVRVPVATTAPPSVTTPKAPAEEVVETGASPAPVKVTVTTCVAVRPVSSVTVAVNVSVALSPSSSVRRPGFAV